MRYLEKAMLDYSKSSSRIESIALLEKYKKQLTHDEYSLILNSLSSLAMEGMFLDEKDILLSIAQVQNEISAQEIIEMVKSA